MQPQPLRARSGAEVQAIRPIGAVSSRRALSEQGLCVQPYGCTHMNGPARLGPFRDRGPDIPPDPSSTHLAGEIFAVEEIPGAGDDLERGDLVAPAESSERRGCSSFAVALVPLKPGSEKIAASQVPCVIGGGATSATVRAGGGAPGRRQYCTHCQSLSPSSNSTRCQLSRQPSARCRYNMGARATGSRRRNSRRRRSRLRRAPPAARRSSTCRRNRISFRPFQTGAILLPTFTTGKLVFWYGTTLPGP